MSFKYKLFHRIVAIFVLLAILQSASFVVNAPASIETVASKPLINIFKRKEKENAVNLKDAPRVFPGGMPIGFTINSDGVIIVGISEVETQAGMIAPAKNSGIISGDILVSIENEHVDCVADIDRIINNFENSGRELKIVVKRNDNLHELRITPVIDAAAGTYKLGLWVKDDAAGVGTVTYYTEDGRFGALGHPVCDGETGIVVPVKEGTCYKCDIIGVNKSVKGKPGELKGMFLRNKNIIGSVSDNNTFGLFGSFEKLPENGKYIKTLTVCPRTLVKEGSAKILSTIGNSVEEYDVEIVKVYNQKSPKEKGMVIKVVDSRLLEKTGGIVQGMSGSPILQGDFIVGAVTHVFVNDPTRGYGMFLDFMISANQGSSLDCGIIPAIDNRLAA